MQKVSWFSLPPKVAFYYQKRTPNYKPIPPFMEGCVEKDELSQLHARGMHLCNKLRSLNRNGRMRIQKARELTIEVCCY